MTNKGEIIHHEIIHHDTTVPQDKTQYKTIPYIYL